MLVHTTGSETLIGGIAMCFKGSAMSESVGAHVAFDRLRSLHVFLCVSVLHACLYVCIRSRRHGPVGVLFYNALVASFY